MNSEPVRRGWLRVVAWRIGAPVLFGLSAMFGDAGPAHAADYGAVLAGAQSEFWKAMEEGIQQAATEHRVQVVVRSPVDDDPQTTSQNLQLKMVKWMIDS